MTFFFDVCYYCFPGIELKCSLAGTSADADECHDGGALKGVSVLLTSGPHKKKKGRVTGGGHGYYLIELSGREKGVILKRDTQFKRADGIGKPTGGNKVIANKNKPDSSPQSSRSSSRASGRSSTGSTKGKKFFS
jgi:hypothetical protein